MRVRNGLKLRRPRNEHIPFASRTGEDIAISSEGQGVILYSRRNFSSDAGGAIHCFDLV
jgi:hypothetical protein